jgi:hypothetical protein
MVRWSSIDVLEGHVAGGKRSPASYLLHAGFLLHLLLDSEDGGDIFLQNTG